MSFLEAQSYLNSFTNYELKTASFYPVFNLERVRRLLARLGNPEKNIRCIHIAGTNGKGSTCAFLSYILKEAGYKISRTA